MAKNKISVDSKSGLILGAVFDDPDLSKTSADLKGTLAVKDNKMTLILEIALNDKFEVEFIDKASYENKNKEEK